MHSFGIKAMACWITGAIAAPLNGVRFESDLAKINAHRQVRFVHSTVGVCLPEDLPCSSSGQQTKMQVMCSNQAIVSVVTMANSCPFKDDKNCWVIVLKNTFTSSCYSSSSPVSLSAHHGGTATTWPQLKRWSGAVVICDLRICESQLMRIHMMRLFLQLKNFTWGPGVTQEPHVNSGHIPVWEYAYITSSLAAKASPKPVCRMIIVWSDHKIYIHPSRHIHHFLGAGKKLGLLRVPPT